MTAEQIAAGLTKMDHQAVPLCSDYDEDCDDVPDKVHCYLYDPVRGYCPYLRAAKQ